jgi:hypothetical protein
MKKQQMLISVVVTLAITGCATRPDAENPPEHAKRVKVVDYDLAAGPRTAARLEAHQRPKTDHLDIYENETKPPQRPYKVIALLTCEGAAAEEAAMMEAIFYRARMMGADAVMSAATARNQRGDPIIFGNGGGFGGGGSTRCVYRAKAIVYEDK